MRYLRGFVKHLVPFSLQAFKRELIGKNLYWHESEERITNRAALYDLTIVIRAQIKEEND